MSSFLRTSLTIGGLLLFLLLAVAWGWHQVARPVPALDEKALCEETPVHPGETVAPGQVTVSVLNASRRHGLASRTMEAFTAQGFTQGQSANAPAGSGVRTAQIWTDDPNSPAVGLVASWLGNARIVPKSVTQVGVVVVVGDRFKGVSGGKPSVTATTETTICSPTPT